MRILSMVVALTSSWVGLAAAQSPPQAYSFYTIAGKDTLAIEQVIRTDERVDVDMLLRREGVRFVFTLALLPDGTVDRVENRFFRQPQDEEPTQIVTATFRGDSADVEITGDRPRAITVGTRPGAVPWIPRSNTLIEQMLRLSSRVAGTTDSIPVFNIGNGRTLVATVEWGDAGTATVRLAEAVLVAEFAEDGSFAGGSAVGQEGRVVREDAFRRLPIDEIDYGPPAGAPYLAEEVTVRTSAGLSLSGTLTLPSPELGRLPAVVTITGSGQQDRDERVPGIGGYRPYWELADTLARVGIAVLRLDDRGINDSEPGPADATFLDYADDVRSALEYLRSSPKIDGRRLFLVGHSQGGAVAPLVAADDPTLAGIVLLAAPAYVGGRVLEAQRWADLDPRYVKEDERASAVERGRRADAARAEHDANLRFLVQYDPIPAAQRVAVPVLILQGETDRQVTPEQADTLATAIRSGGNPDVTVRRFPDLNHFFLQDPSGYSSGYASLPSRTVSREVLGAIADWITERVNSETPRS